LSHKRLGDFLVEQCRQRGLSLRSLSINSGLSPGTVHNIIKRKYRPTLLSLNRLADYLDVERQYLWQLANLLEDEDMDCDTETTFGDPRLKLQFVRVDKLPKKARNLIIGIIDLVIIFFETGGTRP